MDSLILRKGTVNDIPAFLAFFRQSIPDLFTYYSPNSINYTVDVDYNPQMLTNN